MISRLTPVILSLLLLAAHFLRGMKVEMVVLLLALIGFAFYRRPYVRVILRGVLIVGAFIWVLTAGTALIARQEMGEPWLRMVLILGGVALFTLWSSWRLRSPKAVAWYAGPEAGSGAGTQPDQGLSDGSPAGEGGGRGADDNRLGRSPGESDPATRA